MVEPATLITMARASTPVAQLLKKILDYQSEQVRILRRVEHKIDAMLEKSINVAEGYLRDADQVGPESRRGKDYVARALHAFREAYATLQTTDPWRASHVALTISAVQERFGQHREAVGWAQQAYEQALASTQTYVTRANDRIDSRTGHIRWTSFPIASFVKVTGAVGFVILFLSQFAVRAAPDSSLIGVATVVVVVLMIVLILGLIGMGATSRRHHVAKKEEQALQALLSQLDELAKAWRMLDPAAVVTPYQIRRTQTGAIELVT
jgi:hypothetical protein